MASTWKNLKKIVVNNNHKRNSKSRILFVFHFCNYFCYFCNLIAILTWWFWLTLGLKKCTTETQVISRNQDVKICTPTMVKVCPDTPCKTCPVFCQPLKQIWCEDDFKVCKPSKEIYTVFPHIVSALE